MIMNFNGYEFELDTPMNKDDTINKWEITLRQYGVRGFVKDIDYNADRSRLQAKFLDKDFAKKCLMYFHPKETLCWYVEDANERLSVYAEKKGLSLKDLSVAPLSMDVFNAHLYEPSDIWVKFEDDSNCEDVTVVYGFGDNPACAGYAQPDNLVIYFILKPVIGDDYPILIQQMQAVNAAFKDPGSYVFIYEKFDAKGISEEQFLKIFDNVLDMHHASHLVSVKEIEAVKLS